MTQPPTELKARTGYRKYDHLERQGHLNTRGIEEGRVYVFPKLDGTNACVWSDGHEVFTGSRRRQLTSEKNGDNAGFHAWVHSTDPKANELRQMARLYPDLIFYGEWLVPHTLKTYRQDAWGQFYVFDVFERSEEFRGYIKYESYKGMLDNAGIAYIVPLAIFNNPTGAQLKEMTEENDFLITEGQGVGEGVVVKNYEWRAEAPQGWDRVWGKFVRAEFKSDHRKTMGPPEREGLTEVERAIAEQFVTGTLVEKNVAKVLIDVFNGLPLPEEGHESRPEHPDFRPYMIANYRGRIIPQLLGRVWADIINEELPAIIKKFKSPTIDFKRLQALVTLRIKAIAQDIF